MDVPALPQPSSATWSPPPLHRRLPRRLRRLVGSRFCLDLGRGHHSTVFVAGSGRSGTSWLAELLNHGREYHYIFEPFHPPEYDSPTPIQVGLTACAEFTYHLYLRPDNRDVRFLGPATAVLSGRARSRWTEQFNQVAIARRRIVKEVTANLLLRWFYANFPGMPIVLILRHPCAVVASRGSLNWDPRWDVVLSRVLTQQHLLDDFIAPFIPLFESASDYVERQALMWCLDTYVPLRQFSPGEIHVVFYEQLVARPEVEIPRLFGFLRKTVPPGIYDAMQAPSLLSDWNNPVLRGASRLDAWRSKMPAGDRRRVMDIVTAFGLDAIYSDEPSPNTAGLRSVMSRAPAAAGR